MAQGYDALLLLGGDLGDPRHTLDRAEELLALRAGSITSCSRDHWTEPWGFAGAHLFLNRAVMLHSDMEPRLLMNELLAVEAALGRTRDPGRRYTSRTIDIDVLLIGGQVIDLPGLSVPHPRMHERAFALAPAADIAPLQLHPVLHRSVLDLLNDLRQRR